MAIERVCEFCGYKQSLVKRRSLFRCVKCDRILCNKCADKAEHDAKSKAIGALKGAAAWATTGLSLAVTGTSARQRICIKCEGRMKRMVS